MARGFAPAPPPWVCRIYREDMLFASMRIGNLDGTPIKTKDAQTTAILIVSFLQEPTNTGCQCRLALRLGDDAVQSLMGIVGDLGDNFRVDLVSPQNQVKASGYSVAAARLMSNRLGEKMRVIDPTRVRA